MSHAERPKYPHKALVFCYEQLYYYIVLVNSVNEFVSIAFFKLELALITHTDTHAHIKILTYQNEGISLTTILKTMMMRTIHYERLFV